MSAVRFDHIAIAHPCLSDVRNRSWERGRIPSTSFGEDARAWVFEELRKGLAPLRETGKLGYVLFQLAPCVKRSDEAQAQLARLPRELPDDVIAVEFRNRSWFGEHLDESLRLLEAHSLTYVSIDGPRSRATVPSLPALTSPTAVFRLHGPKGISSSFRARGRPSQRSTITSTARRSWRGSPEPRAH